VGTSLGRRDSYLSLAVRFALWRVARWGFYIVIARLPKRTPSDEEKAPRLHAELLAGRHSGLRGYLRLPRSRQASNSAHWTKFLSAPIHVGGKRRAGTQELDSFGGSPHSHLPVYQLKRAKPRLIISSRQRSRVTMEAVR
jgi:hypothetical protein